MILLHRFHNILCWFPFLGRADKKYFLETLPYLYTLEIPSIIWNIPICDGKCLKNERQVLLNLNQLLGGRKWIKKWGVYSKNGSQNHSFHCNWHGILCDNRTSHVLGIDLIENNVVGDLTADFFKLQFLLHLGISRSTVTGKFQNVIATMPKHLLRLNLAYTKVSGRIPSNIANNVPILAKLQLTGSKLTGEIPESVGELVHLTVLSLGATLVRGSIPKSISRLNNLWFLDFQTLGLKGDLLIVHNLRKLRYLYVSSNKLTGTIPEDIGVSCPSLMEILLPNNELSGFLPRSLGSLKNLVVLDVSKNKLSGYIPVELFYLNLHVLLLSSNQFTGFEARSNDQFRNLTTFMASHLPAFNCSLRSILSCLRGSTRTIMQIDISHSNIYGNIPGFVFDFERLTSLKLASNRISGKIPSPWHNMPYFTLLDLQNNYLSGPIPLTFSRLLMLTELNVQGNKYLEGPVSSSFFILDYTVKIKDRRSDSCPMVKFVHNSGTIYVDSSYYSRSYCYCDEHFFGNGVFCLPCMRGGLCPGAKWVASHAKSVPMNNSTVQPLDSTMSLKKGYFPFPNNSFVKSIHKCPSSGRYYKTCVPKGICKCYVNTKEQGLGIPGQMVTTVDATRVHCNKSCLCLLGHSGRYCSQCINGYYKEGIRCIQCPVGSQSGLKFGTLFGITIGSILVSIAILYLSTRRLKLSIVLAMVEIMVLLSLVLRHLVNVVFLHITIIIFILGFSSHLRKCSALLKSAMFYVQIMDSLVSTTDIWPISISSIQIYISSSFSLCFSSLACILPNFFTLPAKSCLLFSIPFGGIGLIWMVYFLFKTIKKPIVQKLSELKYKCLKYSIVILDLAYFPIVKNCFSIIVGCRDIEGVSFMKRYAWIDCNTSEHHFLTIIAIFELILYVIAVPFFIYLPLLLRYREHLSDDTSHVNIWLSPLIAPYKPNYKAYIEVLMLLRRLLIAMLMTSFPTNSALQIQCITMLLLSAIVFQAITRPFKNPREMISGDERCKGGLGLENGVDISMLSCVLLSFVCVGLFADHGNLVSSALFKIMISINGIFVAAFFGSVLYRLLSPSSKEDHVISTDLVEPLIDATGDGYSMEHSES